MVRSSASTCVARLLAPAAFLAVAVPRAPAAQEVARRHATASLVSELDAITPGARWLVALRLASEPGWHTYWRNAGDAGSPPSLDWSLPRGFGAGPILWPTPHRIAEGPLAVYGYGGETLLLVELEAPRDLVPGRPVNLTADASWVVCREVCVADHAPLRLRVSVAARPSPDPYWSPRLLAARARLPRAFPAWRVSAAPAAAGYTLHIAPPPGWRRPLSGVVFFPASPGVLDHAAAQPLERRGAGYALTLTRSSYATASATRLTGLLVVPGGWDEAGALAAMEVDVPVDVP
jgi:DsbC/DsbD-like thiol-disulfide interchange protein